MLKKASREALASLRTAAHTELTQHILPYWAERMIDAERGGFIGQIDGSNQRHPLAPRGAVLNARILWTFSAAARHLHTAAYADLAKRAYRYISTYFWDREAGGIYWLVNADGTPNDSNKQTYAQGFALYGFAEYYRLAKDPLVLQQAQDLFYLMEAKTTDPVHDGYFEVFDRTWRLLEGVPLSDKDLSVPKSMNTHLHVLEAYTNLYRIWPDASVHARLVALVERFMETILDQQTGHLRLFFEDDWRPTGGTVSYGHDIEASWLLVEAAEAVGDEDLLLRTRRAALYLADIHVQEGIDTDGGIFNEIEPNGHRDEDKYWWPAAEAVVGLLNAFAMSSQHRFLDQATQTWAFIERHLIDTRDGEWFFRVKRDGTPYRSDNKAGPWKCPYHNGRACLEIIYRIDQLLESAERNMKPQIVFAAS